GLSGFLTTEADVAPSCLVIPGIGDRGNFLVAVHGRNLDFNVVGSGHGGGAVASSQLHSTEVEAQALDQVFCLADQFFKSLVGIFGAGELEHLYLVELMAPDHAPLVGPVRAGLPA